MHLDDFLLQTVAIFASAVVVVFLSARIRLPPIIGLIVTGLVIGPSGLGWVSEVEQVEAFAEIGVVLLLFIIGLELSIGQLRRLGRPFLLGGTVQAGLTVAAVTALAVAVVPTRTALFVGMAAALSSTAVVLKLYGDRRETQTPQGRTVLAILLYQDFLIVPLILVTPMLAGTEAGSPVDLLVRFGGGLVAIAAVVLAARFLMPRLLHQLVRVRVRELFVLTALLSCLAMSWFTYTLGFSLALGAFLAGILISETEYGHQMIADVVPFRDVFASLFFISIGMLVDIPFALGRLPMLLGIAVVLVAVKALAAGAAIKLVGYPLRIAVIGGLGLAQLGEFSFVLMEVGRSSGLLDAEGFQTLLVAAVLTLLATPLLVGVAPSLGERLTRRFGLAAAPSEGDLESAAVAKLSGHVIVAGYGATGKLMCRVLGEAGIPYVVVELNAATVRKNQEAGVPTLYGDVTRREILDHAKIEAAQAMVFAISDLASVRRGVALARFSNPQLEIIVRTRMIQEIEVLRQEGADEVVAEEFEGAIAIFTLLLERFHVPRNVIRAQTRVLRGEGYRLLRAPQPGARVSAAVLDALAHGTTDIYRIEPDGRAAAATLKELDLRARTGASVIALVRGETSHVNPSPDERLEPGDCLVLVGSHREMEDAFLFLDQGVLPTAGPGAGDDMLGSRSESS